MNEPFPSDRPSVSSKQPSSDRYAYLRAEAAAPYRGLRKFIYVAFGASGFIGVFVFLTQAIAGRDLDVALPNLALQLGVVALMIWLFRLEGKKSSRQAKKSP